MPKCYHRQSDLTYLAGLTVFIEEDIYVRQLQSFFASIKDLFFRTRYVDNLPVVVLRKVLEDRRLQHLLNNNFYQHLVQLEHVTRKDAFEEFSGCDLQLNHHRLQLLLRPDLWKKFVNQIMQDPKSTVLQLFIAPEHTSNDMSGPLIFEKLSLNASGRTSEPLVSDTLGSAHDPLFFHLIGGFDTPKPNFKACAQILNIATKRTLLPTHRIPPHSASTTRFTSSADPGFGATTV